MKTTKPVPAIIKKQRGTFREDRDGGYLEPIGMKSLPISPAHYTEDQKALWYDVCTFLQGLGIMQTVGVIHIEVLCDYLDIYKTAKKHLDEKGLFVKEITEYGINEKTNPSLHIMNKAHDKMMTISREFGFTPLAQSKIRNIGNEDKSKKGAKGSDEFGDI